MYTAITITTWPCKVAGRAVRYCTHRSATHVALAGERLSVVVMVSQNNESSVVSVSADDVAACLDLPWQHRKLMLAG